jgi:hypothetical protein
MGTNKRIVLIVGEQRTGKSRSLKTIKHPERVAYANCDCKDLSFKDKFAYHEEFTDPSDLPNYIDAMEAEEDIDTIVIDTITYLMRSFKINYIDDAIDSRAGWGNMQKYYNKLMLQIKASSMNVIILGHVFPYIDEESGEVQSKMDFQGSIARSPVGDFTTVLETKSLNINKKLLKMENDTFNFSDRDTMDGIKYCFITRRTKAYPYTLARSAEDLWEDDQLLINNDLQIVLDKLEDYYGK